MFERVLIEPQAFADNRQVLQGRVALKDLDGRVHSPDMADLEAQTVYSLRGGRDRQQRRFLDLTLSGLLPLYCQRCLQPVDFHLDENVRIVLFDDEAALDRAMLADEELEGMLCPSELDVAELLEDQILMALPFSPKHEHCGAAERSVVLDKPNPFAVLADLKKPVAD